MTVVDLRYPNKLSDKRLKALVAEYQAEILKEKASPNSVLRWVPLVQLGLSEIQGREAKKTAERQSQRAEKMELLSIRISILALLIALASAIATMGIAQTTARANERWEQNQLEYLQSITTSINEFSTPSPIPEKVEF